MRDTRHGEFHRTEAQRDVATNLPELAEREGIAFTYTARLMRLSLLAREIVDAIKDGRQPATVTLAKLMDSLPLEHGRDQKLAA